MMLNQRPRLTPVGIAKLLGRGILATFEPACQTEEITKLIDLLRDMAVSREVDADLGSDRLAAHDTRWLRSPTNSISWPQNRSKPCEIFLYFPFFQEL
jgi:hypothetical protein